MMENNKESFVNSNESDSPVKKDKFKGLKRSLKFFTLGCATVQTAYAAVLMHKIALDPSLLNADLISWNTVGKVAGVAVVGHFLYEKYKENVEASDKFCKTLLMGLNSVSAGLGLHLAYKVAQNPELLNPDLITFPHVVQAISVGIVGKYLYDMSKKDELVTTNKPKLKM